VDKKNARRKLSEELFCPLILKGTDDFVDKKFDRYPAIFVGE
jgi:hypothetical protein